MPSSSHELQANFATEVLEASNATPILVDFWAEWCAPCRMLGPVLENLASESGAGWRLVKVDTEAHPDLAQQYGIRGIPNVKLFHRGEVVAEFSGALPEAQVRAWLRDNLPSPHAGALDAARAAIQSGDVSEAQRLLEEIVRADSSVTEAKLELARLLLESDPRRARELAASVTIGQPGYEIAEQLQVLARLIGWVHGSEIHLTDAEPMSEEHVALYRDGALALSEGRHEDALRSWIDLLQRNRQLDDDGARRACIALFGLLGENHALTQGYRRRFSMALH